MKLSNDMKNWATTKNTEGKMHGFYSLELYKLDREELQRLLQELDFAMFDRLNTEEYNDTVKSVIKEYDYYMAEEGEN